MFVHGIPRLHNSLQMASVLESNGLICNPDTPASSHWTIPSTKDITISIVIESLQSCRQAVVTAQSSICVESGIDGHNIKYGVAQRYP
mmetsp:Transcript_26719/g.27075  ORF Transcript_26719/g.27075 Transcript_26719/m.27075 type:complete len:88 (-) Transcript_26719:17-280(-)